VCLLCQRCSANFVCVTACAAQPLCYCRAAVAPPVTLIS
jgi:hypothetical protein